jgi:tRNA(Arg) A34 adenosine deaminase TadA
MSETTLHLMRRAVMLSAEHMRRGLGGPFGALIARDGKVIAEGFNQVTSANDPTAHAEVVAIREACAKLGSFNLAGCEIYTSCEPCPMCLGAIYWARLERIYFANSRADAAAIGFDDDHIYREMPKRHEERSIPIEQVDLEEARAIFREWQEMPDKVKY